MSRKNDGADVLTIGPRMDYAVARSLASSGRLAGLFTDLAFDGRIGQSIKPVIGERLRRRILTDPGMSPIHIAPALIVASQAKRIFSRRGWQSDRIDPMIAGSLWGLRRRSKSAIAVATSGNALEFCCGREVSVIEQISAAPAEFAKQLNLELGEFKGWSHEQSLPDSSWFGRMSAEWRLATRVVVPSRHLIASCVDADVPASKFICIPYPVPDIVCAASRRSPDAARPKLIIVGRVSLMKGVQYVEPALRAAGLLGSVDVELVGNNMLTEKGRSCLAFADCVGAARHDDVCRRMAAADALIIPSMSEGSSLVGLEGIALDRPLVASPWSGVPEGCALVSDPRDSVSFGQAIGEALFNPTVRSRLALARERARAELTLEGFATRWDKVTRRDGED